MTELLQFTLFGVMLGCIYAIAAMGLVLTYTVTGVFNFAHGAVGMIAAFCYYELRIEQGWPTPVAGAAVVFGLCPLMGLLTERLLRRFSGAGSSTSLVVTVALTVAFLGLAQRVFDPSVARNLPLMFGERRIVIGSVPISYDRIAHVAIAVAIAFGLRFLLFNTDMGAQMRSVVDDPELARLNGVRDVWIARCSWMIGFVLAGIGGVLFASGQGLQTIVLTFLVLNAFAAAMIGRLRSLPLTFLGALALGLTQELTNVTWLWPDSELFIRLRLAIPGLFLIVAVALVPSARLAAGRVVGVGQPAIPTLRRALLGGAGLVAFVLLLVELLPEQYDVHVVRALVIATIGLSLVTLTGLSGQLSLAQYLFLGVGAYVASTSMGRGPGGMVLGGLAAAVLGLVVALPSVRLKGLHLALSTFGFALAGRELLIGDSHLFGLGGRSVPRPTILGLSTASDGAFAVWCSIVFSLIGLGLVALRRSRVGRQLTAVRDSEIGASSIGTKVRTAKLLVFAGSAFVAGCAGSLFGGLQGVADATQFEPVNGLVIVLFVFVGGVTSITGALFAGALFSLLALAQSEVPSAAGLVFVGVGAAAVALGRQPNGLAGIVLSLKVGRRPRTNPFTEQSTAEIDSARPPAEPAALAGRR